MGLDWKSIRSAPRDGRSFWGIVDGNAIRMFWHEGFQEFVSGFRRMYMAPGYTIDGAPFKDHSPEIHRPEFWTEIPVFPEGD